jgi:hypothetical protein
MVLACASASERIWLFSWRPRLYDVGLLRRRRDSLRRLVTFCDHAVKTFSAIFSGRDRIYPATLTSIPILDAVAASHCGYLLLSLRA